MLPSSRLKLVSLLFGVLWTLVMFWWSGDYGVFNAAVLAVCGTGAGFAWFCLMRRQIARGRIPSRP